MSQRQDFIELYLQRQRSVRELCVMFGVSEKTGYKWLRRYHAEGGPGLADRARAPLSSPQRLSADVLERIVALRQRHPTYGARKLREMLRRVEPTIAWPAPSTIGELLKCRGLIRRRRGHRARGVPWDATAYGLTRPAGANEVWGADFKGEFRLATGAYCYPLTITDLHSRYLLGCTALPSTASASARLAFTRVFREFGLPQVLRTDNGVPFAQPNAIGRLSALTIWWIRLGIRPERIRPGAPQQNGQHERMHRTLKADATRPPAANFREQQRRFDRFRGDFNTIRPHESLDMQPPAQRYTPSPRPWPRRLPPLEYPAVREVRLVTGTGAIRFRTRLFFLTSALAGQPISLEETGDAEWTVCFGPLTLGIIDERRLVFNPGVCWSGETSPHNNTLTSPMSPV